MRKQGRNGCQNGEGFCPANIATVCEWHVFVHGLYTISDDIQGSRFLLLFSHTPTLCSLVKVLFSHFRVTFRSSIVHWMTMIRAATRLSAIKKIKTKYNFDISLCRVTCEILPNIPENSPLINYAMMFNYIFYYVIWQEIFVSSIVFNTRSSNVFYLVKD